MPVRLTNPLQSVTLETAQIAAIKIEETPHKGQRYVEIWVVFGRMEGDPPVFVQYAHPRTGSEAAYYFKIENGHHPLEPSVGLGRCQNPDCHMWLRGQADGVCQQCGIDGVQPYDGWSRIALAAPAGRTIYEAIGSAAYGFLLSEVVPDPVSWEPVRLLDGYME